MVSTLLTMVFAAVAALVGATWGWLEARGNYMGPIVIGPPIAAFSFAVTFGIRQWLKLPGFATVVLAGALAASLGALGPWLERRDHMTRLFHVAAPGYTETLEITAPARAVVGEPVRLGSLLTQGPWTQIELEKARKKGLFISHSSDQLKPLRSPGQLPWYSQPEEGVHFESLYGPEHGSGVGKQLTFKTPGRYQVWAKTKMGVRNGPLMSNIVEIEVVEAATEIRTVQ